MPRNYDAATMKTLADHCRDLDKVSDEAQAIATDPDSTAGEKRAAALIVREVRIEKKNILVAWATA